MSTMTRLSLLLPPLLLAACAATPPAKDFPAGARAPSAAELTTLLRGKSFDVVASNATFRVQYAADSDGVTALFSGRSDSGTWRAENGQACYQFKVIPSACNEVRLVGKDIYQKQSSGEVVRLAPR